MGDKQEPTTSGKCPSTAPQTSTFSTALARSYLDCVAFNTPLWNAIHFLASIIIAINYVTMVITIINNYNQLTEEHIIMFSMNTNVVMFMMLTTMNFIKIYSKDWLVFMSQFVNIGYCLVVFIMVIICVNITIIINVIINLMEIHLIMISVLSINSVNVLIDIVATIPSINKLVNTGHLLIVFSMVISTATIIITTTIAATIAITISHTISHTINNIVIINSLMEQHIIMKCINIIAVIIHIVMMTSIKHEVKATEDQPITEFTPDIHEDNREKIYRFRCDQAGRFQCSVTGLVFGMEGEGELLYKTLHWDHLFLHHTGKRPAGPLYHFSSVTGSAHQLHLPHCDIKYRQQFFHVAHLTKEGDVAFKQPIMVTETHVIVDIMGFSGYGLTKNKDAPSDPIRALVLLLLHNAEDDKSTIHVLMLPKNISIKEVKDKREELYCIKEVLISVAPDCKLIPDKDYLLSVDPEHQVNPEKAPFYEDNFFDKFVVKLKDKCKNLPAMTLTEVKNEAASRNAEPVWTCPDITMPSTYIRNNRPLRGDERLSDESPRTPYIVAGNVFFGSDVTSASGGSNVTKPVLNNSTVGGTLSANLTQEQDRKNAIKQYQCNII